MKKRMPHMPADQVVFLPALTPLEAAVLPARERPRAYGVLRMVRSAWEAGERPRPQRTKIWVR